MKRLILIVIVSCLSLVAICQDNKFLNDINFVVGAGFSHIRGWSIWEPTFGFIVGVETKVYEISEKSSITSGIFFTKQGAPNYKVSSTIYNESGYNIEQYRLWSDGEVSLFYVKIPIQYQFKSNGGFYFEGGIQPGILIGAKRKVDDDNVSNARDAFKIFEFSLPIGLGYWFNDKLGVGIRSDFGLTNMNKEDSFEESFDTTDYSLVLLGVVKYRF